MPTIPISTMPIPANKYRSTLSHTIITPSVFPVKQPSIYPSSQVSSTYTHMRQHTILVDTTSYFLESLEPYYRIINKVPILVFLRDHSEITGALLNAPHEIRKYFANPSLSLEWMQEEGEQYLSVTIISSQEALEKLAALDQFDNMWWLDQAVSSQRILLFTVE
jgi:hypothetical protein